MDSIKHIGLIGLGIMGKPMGLNLLKAGFSLGVYARHPETAQTLVTAGATFYDSVARLAAEVDVLITMVSDTPDVEAILLGKDGVITQGKAGLLVIDMSTISPVATQKIAADLAKQGIRFLDAPVSGGEAGAIAGTLTIMVGGKTEDFEQALPVLAAMGKTITHIGEHGAGQMVKACNNLIIAQTVVAISEAFEMAKMAGVDLDKARTALMGGFANSKAMEVHAKRIIDNQYTPGFKAKLHHKDLQIVAKTLNAYELNLPASQYVIQAMRQLVEQGDGELDSAAVAKIVQQTAHPKS
ncbi:NAD(P)-dependent oxidoreductase [Thiolinea disciformis]|uniref:NAD(P)-dependent oxidoreductase n=1 Tax=Thiolinea disciformis TaxID=125614 RepID=UPI0003A56681|nr:NAD(P)-dependent oxidoreductase [Thiolinea disciformis]